MEGLERIVSEHRLFDGLGPEFVNLAAGCAKNVRFNADQYLFHAEDAGGLDLSDPPWPRSTGGRRRPAAARCSSRRWARATSSA